jgi:hypothetical protein
LQSTSVVMLARPELLVPLAFSVSGLLIVAALVLLGITMRQARQIQHVSTWRGSARPRERAKTQNMLSGATAAALDEMARPNPARQRQARIYA